MPTRSRALISFGVSRFHSPRHPRAASQVHNRREIELKLRFNKSTPGARIELPRRR